MRPRGRATVTAATTADAALVHALTQRAWHGTVAANSSAYLETAADIEALFARGGGALVARVDGVPVGSVRHVPVPHGEPSWEIKRMGLLREARGAGLGPLLAAAVEDAARAAGVGRLQLGVRRDQPRLVAFWATLGFEADASVALSSHNPLTEPPVTMSRRLGHAAPHRPR
ncbi:MAG: GNAT family N-acetyltransferase [Burkholderiaceae bacterium]|nr:GNAT family N-acetyltransferase [Burkholderiaceae bacterium]